MASKEAKSRALVLEMLGDLPDVEARAPENVSRWLVCSKERES